MGKFFMSSGEIAFDEEARFSSRGPAFAVTVTVAEASASTFG